VSYVPAAMSTTGSQRPVSAYGGHRLSPSKCQRLDFVAKGTIPDLPFGCHPDQDGNFGVDVVIDEDLVLAAVVTVKTPDVLG
jgi:hypothetical protein